ncbi:RNA polymerase sigma factor [Bacillus horti]|nr:RNA polymerase sigma factor [Bacillus horti]
MIQSNREVQDQFKNLTEPFRDELWRYCRYITGSPWDGEDLFQETLLKAFGMLYQRWHPTNPKSYLFRMATNLWIDWCRKQKVKLDPLQEENAPVEYPHDSLELEEAVYLLTNILPPRQTAAFLLLDIFHFSGSEVAGMLHSTQGGVYAAAKRARETLKNRIKEGKPTEEQAVDMERVGGEGRAVIDAYLKAFNSGDITAMLELFNEHTVNEAVSGFQEYSKNEMRSGSLQGGKLGAVFAEERVLWGRRVIITFAQTEQGKALHDVQYQEVENSKIVAHKSYFFCKQFLFAVSKELGVPVQLNKPPVNWEQV